MATTCIELRLTFADGGATVLCECCEVADSPLRRMRGLLGRRGLEPGQGVILRPASSIHTFFMRFPIDVVFLDTDLRVLGIEYELPPWRTAGMRGAHIVVELPGGECERRGVRIGDTLAVA